MTIPIPIYSTFRYTLPPTRFMAFLMKAVSSTGYERSTREKRFADLIHEYSGTISGICLSYAADTEDFQDLRQDIMLNIWKGLPTFRAESALSTWVYRVALNTCVSTVRKRSKRLPTVSLESLAEIASESETGSIERIERLRRLISGLSALDKAVITMWLDDRKYSEIAEVTGLSRNNVAVRINRIKQKLHHKLSPLT
ncbi:MAG: sigma-70 family RNA polymerase sigma factor [Muribaculaceae bacterium]|nr:sigma-70 family RNA polymerase sigma factor [Muribaculaceae bacterium]